MGPRCAPEKPALCVLQKQSPFYLNLVLSLLCLPLCLSVSRSSLPPIRSLLTLFWNRRQTVAFNLIKIK